MAPAPDPSPRPPAAPRLPVELRPVDDAEPPAHDDVLREATWRRVEVRGARPTGVRLTDARLDEVVVRDCRIDLAALGGSRLRRVVLGNAGAFAGHLGIQLLET